MVKVNPALVGKAGELLVAAELMRRGIEVAHPASDVGVDLLAYRLDVGQKTARRFVPIQVKSYSGTGYRFLKRWFEQAPGLALVSVWHLVSTPQFYVFENLADVEAAIANHTHTSSWTVRGIWSGTEPSGPDAQLMQPHLGRWERITHQVTTDPDA